MNNTSTTISNLNRVSASMLYYDNIIYLAVGVPFNLVNILVFTRLMLNKTNKTNMGFLGLCQSIIYIILLLYFSLVFRTQFFGINFANTNDSLCKFLNFIRRLLTTVSSWMEVITTFDRFVFVIFGHTGRFRYMEKNLALIILCVFILLALANTNNLFYYWTKGTCTADYDILIASDLILICLRTYFPLFCMFIFNSFMIRIVFKKSKAALKESSRSRKQCYFTISVIAKNVYFLILNVPITLYFIFYDINLYSGAINGDALFAAYYNFYGNIAKDLSFYVQTLTFLVYFTFNKLYRKEVLTLISKVIPIEISASVYPSNNQTITNTPQGTA
jgi:hypothetical protein